MSNSRHHDTSPLPSSFDENQSVFIDFYNENGLEKIWRRFREEPFIPLGCAVTTWALLGASRSMRRGNHKLTNIYFRRRLYAQTFTIAAMVAGNLYWQEDRVERKESKRKISEKERIAKRERWIKELEARDLEERKWKNSSSSDPKA